MKKKDDYPIILTVKHVAEIMQCSDYHARNVMNLKGFPVVRLGINSRMKRVGRDSFFKWLDWYQDQQMQELNQNFGW